MHAKKILENIYIYISQIKLDFYTIFVTYNLSSLNINVYVPTVSAKIFCFMSRRLKVNEEKNRGGSGPAKQYYEFADKDF
jgi:hypothetical protein